MKVKNNQSGQVAIIILLIMVVLLTVGLSLASRTTQEVFLSTQEAESARVFNAAESGVEDALSYDFEQITEEYENGELVSVNPSDPYAENVSTVTTINPNNELETKITEGSTVHIDLDNYGSSTFQVDWSRKSACDAASIIVSTYYDDSGTTKVVHDAFGTNDCTARSGDEFTQEAAGSGTYLYSHAVTLPSDPLFARVKAIYNDTSLRVTGGSGFPTQFFTIRSQADNQLGDENRTIEVGRSLSTAPGFMDYSIYSGGSLTQ